jgi:hypothetical protein
MPAQAGHPVIPELAIAATAVPHLNVSVYWITRFRG